MPVDENILKMKGITKNFPGVKALDNCNFDLKEGEIHALIGENGAGKSTLMKVMCGIYNEFDGDYTLFSKPVHFKNVKEAQNNGISIVHQELNMMQDLTVAQNIFIGRESNSFFCDDKNINKRAAELIKRFDIQVGPKDLLKNLTVGKSQMVEIARAMSFKTTRILILDEPTATLSGTEAADLFSKMRVLKKQGISIIFISHRLGEIMEIADRVTVMRDGAYIDTLDIETCSEQKIITLMIGRSLSIEPKSKSNVAEDAPVVLEAKNLNSSKVKDVSFNLKKGEILGFAGLVGAGRTETMRLIIGADYKYSGDIFINKKIVDINHTKDAIKNGIGYLSEDRKRYGLVLGLSITDNTVLASYSKLKRGLVVLQKACVELTNKYISTLRTKTPSSKQKVKNLSGGNQQKVVIAKWLLRDVDILIFDEPTRGIDVGARAEIYNLMDKLVSQGKSIIMVSSDLTEILKMSDRIIVMSEGRKIGELDISEADQEKIMTLATQHQGGE